MADFSWTPPIAVLATGAIVGAVVVAVRSRARGERGAQGVGSALAGGKADLRRQYDALIRRLAEGASPEERTAIELQAAMVLREMETEASSKAKAAVAAVDAGTAPEKPGAAPRQTPAWLGFLYGVATMAVLGGLVYFASAGAAERKDGGGPTGGNGMGSARAATSKSEAEATTATDAAEVQTLEEAVRKSPKDLPLRIELARAYLHRRDLMKVFDQTKAALEIEPGNPQAMTYQALVRVAMGQAPEAEAMLKEALKKDPQIEDAYIHLALARIQQGNRKGAEEAIQEAQKRFPEDKEQLAQVFTQITSAPQTDGAAAPAGHPEPDAAEAPPAAGGTPGITVVVDLPKGMSVPENAILFVIVREAGLETGPPAAVKRVPAINFPITVTLTDKDSMAGESLPGLVRIDARVDRDGNPLSKDPRDPVASEDNVRPGAGQTFLVLAIGKG